MKIGGHPTSFLVKYFEISQIPTRVFVLVKSEFYKNMGYLCAVLTTAGCCMYTSRHPLSLFTVIAEKIRITCVQFTHCYQVFPFSVKFSNLKHRLLDALFKIKRQSEVAEKKLKFSISFVVLVRTLRVTWSKRRNCSQEDKVSLIVVVFQFIIFVVLLVLRVSLVF